MWVGSYTMAIDDTYFAYFRFGAYIVLWYNNNQRNMARFGGVGSERACNGCYGLPFNCGSQDRGWDIGAYENFGMIITNYIFQEFVDIVVIMLYGVHIVLDLTIYRHEVHGVVELIWILVE